MGFKGSVAVYGRTNLPWCTLNSGNLKGVILGLNLSSGGLLVLPTGLALECSAVHSPIGCCMQSAAAASQLLQLDEQSSTSSDTVCAEKQSPSANRLLS